MVYSLVRLKIRIKQFRDITINSNTPLNHSTATNRRVVPEGEELDILGNEFTIDKLSVSSNRPAEASKHQTSGQRNINDNLLLGRFLFIPNGD